MLLDLILTTWIIESAFYPAYYSALTQQLWFLLGQNLVEDVIVPLSLELIGDTRLLQQIYKRKKM